MFMCHLWVEFYYCCLMWKQSQTINQKMFQVKNDKKEFEAKLDEQVCHFAFNFPKTF